jgi:hypothetical protein
MKNTSNNMTELKIVGGGSVICKYADSVKVNYSLPFEPTNLEMVRKAVGSSENAIPNDIFEDLIRSKRICSPEMLMEMFHLDNKKAFRSVFREGRLKYTRDYLGGWLPRRILEREFDYDKDYRPIRIALTPAQIKLRALLLKRVKWADYQEMCEDLEENYGYDILYEIGADVAEDCEISEEELLDALRAYQAEHRA